MAKDYAKAFYLSTAWSKCRKDYTRSVGGLCERCAARGMIVPGKFVHHIRKLTPENIDDPAITMGFDNLMLLCQDCHAAEHAAKHRFSVGRNGEILPPVNR